MRTDSSDSVGFAANSLQRAQHTHLHTHLKLLQQLLTSLPLARTCKPVSSLQLFSQTGVSARSPASSRPACPSAGRRRAQEVKRSNTLHSNRVNGVVTRRGKVPRPSVTARRHRGEPERRPRQDTRRRTGDGRGNPSGRQVVTDDKKDAETHSDEHVPSSPRQHLQTTRLFQSVKSTVSTIYVTFLLLILHT